jgi:hypothetical protein
MAIARSEDPTQVAAYEVKRRRVREGLALVGAVVFVALGIWLILDAPTGIVGKAAGALSVAFFGWMAVIAVQRMGRGAAIRLSHEGIHYAFPPRYEARKLIAWRDIEDFGITRVQKQDLNFVRLARYDDLVRQFSDGEAAQTVKAYRRLMRFAGAAAVVAGANFEPEGAADVAHMAHGAIASLADVLRFNRQNFGGEICLGWPDRDRNARRFHELMTAWKDRCGTQR